MSEQKPTAAKQKIFFVHIPKTGGTWFDQTMSKYMEGEDSHFAPIESYMQLGISSGEFLQTLHNRYGWHMSIHESMNAGFNFDDYLKVGICRNPFDMLVSMYYHHSTDGLSTRYAKRKGPSGWGSSNISHNISSFEEFIKRFCDPSVPWVHPQFRKFLFHQIYQPNGECGVDIMLRYEMLNVATAQMLQRIHESNISQGIRSEYSKDTYDSIVKSKKINVSKKRRKKDYRAYYTDELRELVEHACAAELRLFNYNFDGIVSGNNEPNPIVIPTNTFYSPTYPIALAGFSPAEQRKFSYLIARGSSDFNLRLDDMTSLIDAIVNLGGFSGGDLNIPENSVLWSMTHWQSPCPYVDAMVAMGKNIFVDSGDVKKHMIDGQIHGEWLPNNEYRKQVAESLVGLVGGQRTLIHLTDEPLQDHYVHEVAGEVRKKYLEYAAEYEDLKRKQELDARLRDMGVDPDEVGLLQT